MAIANQEEAKAIAEALRLSQRAGNRTGLGGPIAEENPDADPKKDKEDEYPQEITPRLDELKHEREKFDKKAFRTYRDRLHALLMKTYQLGLQIMNEPKKDRRTFMRKELREFLFAQKTPMRPDAPLMDQCVMAVFGDAGRSRRNTYATALRVALTAGEGGDPLPAGDLTTWFEDCGGIEEIRTGQKNKGLTRQQRCELVSKDLLRVIGSVKADQGDFPFTAEDFDSELVLIATYNTKRELEVRAILKNSSALTAAKLAYFSKNSHRLNPKTIKQVSLTPVSASESISDAGGAPA
jgi:hypothetical protein